MTYVKLNTETSIILLCVAVGVEDSFRFIQLSHYSFSFFTSIVSNITGRLLILYCGHAYQ